VRSYPERLEKYLSQIEYFVFAGKKLDGIQVFLKVIYLSLQTL